MKTNNTAGPRKPIDDDIEDDLDNDIEYDHLEDDIDDYDDFGRPAYRDEDYEKDYGWRTRSNDDEMFDDEDFYDDEDW